jgi:hypothetical protein
MRANKAVFLAPKAALDWFQGKQLMGLPFAIAGHKYGKGTSTVVCQPVTFMIAAIDAPSWDRSKLRTRSCLVVRLRELDTRAAFCLVLKLRRLETLERERDFAFDRGIGTSEMGDTIVGPPGPRSGQRPAGFGPEAHASASVTNSNAPFPREVQQNMSNLVAQLPLSRANSTKRIAQRAWVIVSFGTRCPRKVQERRFGHRLSVGLLGICKRAMLMPLGGAFQKKLSQASAYRVHGPLW